MDSSGTKKFTVDSYSPRVGGNSGPLPRSSMVGVDFLKRVASGANFQTLNEICLAHRAYEGSSGTSAPIPTPSCRIWLTFTPHIALTLWCWWENGGAPAL